MKLALPIFIAAVLGAVMTYITVKSPAPNRTPDSTEQESQISQLRKELNAAKARTARIETVEIRTEVPTETQPKSTGPRIEHHMAALKALTPEQDRMRRLAVYHLESITEVGPEALPEITNFFEEGVDLHFQAIPKPETEPTTDEERRRARWRKAFRNRVPSLPSLNTTFPATLRLGLIESTANIGGEPAVETLVQLLSSTARGIEVAYLEAALENLAPETHRDTVLKVSRDILTNPPVTSDEPLNKVDRESMGYLYALLIKYKDLNFVETAKTKLITAEGALDSYALTYLREVLGENAMPILLAAYTDPRITDPTDKIILRDAALRFIGRNAEADQIFFETVKEGLTKMKEGDMFDMKRYEHIGQPLGALMKDIGDQPTEVIVNRRKLLGQVRGQSADLLLQFGLNMMDKELGKVQQRREESPKP